jgi:transcriptional regulator with XRE-family HTH domain
MAKNKPPSVDDVRHRLRDAAAAAGLTQQEIGERMGFAGADARKAVSRLLNPNVEYDPRLSTLLRFAEAVEKPLAEIL